MNQPSKKKKPISQTKPVNKKKTKKDDRLPPKTKHKRVWRKPVHKEYGTSKLEERFAREFLDKLGVRYQYQFKAEEIGRYYDFRIVPDGPIIELNGSYWHGDPRLYEEKDLNKVQKRAQKVDEYKEKWALAHGIPIYYIWEKDINEKPKSVMDYLRNILNIEQERKIKIENKKKRH